MAVSPSSSVQRARQQLAERLREIRLDAGLTARALSAAAGWHEAKTSRIESTRQALSDADIQAWCRVCSAEREAPDLIAASRAADSMYVEWWRLTRTGLRHTQDARRPLYERTHQFKVYCSTVVPGFLQTPAYASALLLANSGFHAAPDDVDDAVRARMGRHCRTAARCVRGRRGRRASRTGTGMGRRRLPRLHRRPSHLAGDRQRRGGADRSHPG
jgi:transcriptional regulator with XRE-family HTH domain